LAGRKPGKGFRDPINTFIAAYTGVTTNPVEGDWSKLDNIGEKNPKGFDSRRVSRRDLGGGDSV
jgi:hypothetical protein